MDYYWDQDWNQNWNQDNILRYNQNWNQDNILRYNYNWNQDNILRYNQNWNQDNILRYNQNFYIIFILINFQIFQASSLQSPDDDLDTEFIWAQLLSSRFLCFKFKKHEKFFLNELRLIN